MIKRTWREGGGGGEYIPRNVYDWPQNSDHGSSLRPSKRRGQGGDAYRRGVRGWGTHRYVDDPERREQGGDEGPDRRLPPLAVDDVHQHGNPAEGYEDGAALEAEDSPVSSRGAGWKERLVGPKRAFHDPTSSKHSALASVYVAWRFRYIHARIDYDISGASMRARSACRTNSPPAVREVGQVGVVGRSVIGLAGQRPASGDVGHPVWIEGRRKHASTQKQCCSQKCRTILATQIKYNNKNNNYIRPHLSYHCYHK